MRSPHKHNYQQNLSVMDLTTLITHLQELFDGGTTMEDVEKLVYRFQVFSQLDEFVQCGQKPSNEELLAKLNKNGLRSPSDAQLIREWRVIYALGSLLCNAYSYQDIELAMSSWRESRGG